MDYANYQNSQTFRKAHKLFLVIAMQTCFNAACIKTKLQQKLFVDQF